MPSSRGEASGVAANVDAGWIESSVWSSAEWRKRLVLLVPPAVIAALIIVAGLGLGWHFANMLVLKDARFVGLATSQFMQRTVPEFERAFAEPVTPAQRQAFVTAASFARVVVFELHAPDGRVLLSSRELRPGTFAPRKDKSLGEALLKEALRTREVQAIVDEHPQVGWPLYVGDTFVPLVRDGRLVGVLHVCSDLSDKIPLYREAFGWALMTLVALLALAALLPGAYIWRKLLQLEVAEDRIRFLAFHDSLTGLANRLLFRDRLQQALARSRRDGTQGALLLVDVDRFKQVNDTLGHAAGDSLLQHVAARLRACVRDVDTVARIGGDEFALIIGGLATGADLEPVLARLRGISTDRVLVGSGSVQPGITTGVAFFPSDSGDAAELFRLADAALYRGKAAGRGGIAFHTAIDAELTGLFA